jgi:hypothetical protein
MPETVLTRTDAAARDLEILEELNRSYVRSAEFSDVRWYEEHLAEDFLSTNPDGSLVDRAAFLARMAGPYPGSNLRDTRPDGRIGEGRYTDIYARRGGRWLCVAAHFTRR